MASKGYSNVITSKKKPKEQPVPSAKAPSSHLFVSQTAFELFLFLCLGSGLVNQKLNIYKLVSVLFVMIWMWALFGVVYTYLHNTKQWNC